MEATADRRANFIWNTLGSLSNAAVSLLLAIGVNRQLGANAGGVFAFAYANAQLLYTVGAFEVRPYQSTDVQEKYSFSAYHTLRLATCFVMLAICAVTALAGSFSPEKKAVIWLLGLYKAVEAYTDVWGGRFQQKGRIDIAGRLLLVRSVVPLAVFLLVNAITGSLAAGAAGLALTSLALYFVYDRRSAFAGDKKRTRVTGRELAGLARAVLPLFVGAFMTVAVTNAPKYAIERLYGDEVQNIYNLIFMPTLVIGLFSQLAFRPLLAELAEDWLAGRVGRLRKTVLVLCGGIAALTVLAVLGTCLLGVPVFSWLYGVDIRPYKPQFLLAMASGGIGALMTFSYHVATVLRRQRLYPLICAAALLLSLFTAGRLVAVWGLTGAVASYALSAGWIAVCLLTVNFVTLARGNRRAVRSRLNEKSADAAK